jgi:hypothetical protein
LAVVAAIVISVGVDGGSLAKEARSAWPKLLRAGMRQLGQFPTSVPVRHRGERFWKDFHLQDNAE